MHSLVKKWFEGLRSGEYPQGRYSLEQEGAYCCLGVLHVVGGCELPKERQTSQVPESLRKQVGPGFTELECERLATMNDRGDTFREIAAYINGRADYWKQPPPPEDEEGMEED